MTAASGTALRYLAVAAGLGLIAGCGSVAAPRAHTSSLSRHSAADLGPPGGSRAQASRLAGQLLGSLPLPAGAHLTAGRLPVGLAGTGLSAGAAGSVDVHRLYAVAGQPAAVLAAIARHRRGGMPGGATVGGSSFQSVSYAPRSLPAWAYAAHLLVSVTAGQTGGTLLQTEAQVVAYPWRTAAEYIRPGEYHVLTISVRSLDSRPHAKRVVVTSAAQIASIATLLDRSHAAPDVAVSCPAIFATYRLSLAVSRHSRPAVVLTTTRQGCIGTGVTVLGHKQPALDVGLAGIADRLLGYTPSP